MAHKSPLVKLNGFSDILDITQNTNRITSEITAAPFGFILYFNPSEIKEHKGVDITVLSEIGYNEKRTIEFPVQIFEMNSYFPGDYRSKEEIKNTIDKNTNSGELYD